MNARPLGLHLVVLCAALAGLSQTAGHHALCVKPDGSNGCYATIQGAVNHASMNDVIFVAPGTYAEEVVVGQPLSLIGAGANTTTIDATGLAHGIFVDGFDHPGLHDVTIQGLTVENALFEGIIVVSASRVNISDNHVNNNDTTPGLAFTGATMGCPGQPGNGMYENDETGDCGGAIHLIGVAHSLISGNTVSGNADGLLISDETAESHDNVVRHNIFENNPLECGIVLASHPRSGTPPFAPHFGVDSNTVQENVSIANGVQIGGAGVGLFSDGNGPGRVTHNRVIGNTLIGNGLGGVTLHTHVGPGPQFGGPYPPDDLDGNQIVGNYIAGNLADFGDTATPGTVGININSGEGGSPVRGLSIVRNVIRNEDINIAVNTPAEVDIHFNDLLGGKIGVANVCEYDYTTNNLASYASTFCTGTIDARNNFWGCPAGANGGGGCSTTSGSDIWAEPWLEDFVHRNGRDSF